MMQWVSITNSSVASKPTVILRKLPNSLQMESRVFITSCFDKSWVKVELIKEALGNLGNESIEKSKSSVIAKIQTSLAYVVVVWLEIGHLDKKCVCNFNAHTCCHL